jgi:hypothetical protein
MTDEPGDLETTVSRLTDVQHVPLDVGIPSKLTAARSPS